MNNLRVYRTVAGLRAHLEQLRSTQTIGLVPTMGALHQGHLSLISQAMAEVDLVVVSIFVNPLQFAPTEDLGQYPRQLEEDCQLCQTMGVDVVFAPSPEEMGMDTNTDVTSVTTTAVMPPHSMLSMLCGAVRPGHFPGVSTIVTKLFNIISPHVAYFGEKDAQQLAIIRRLVADLNLRIIIKGCAIVRESSGLAYSSRNQYLSQEEREQSLALFASLKQAQLAFAQGERQANALVETVKQVLALTPLVQVQYVDLVDPQTLTPLEQVEDQGLLAIAAYVGSTRLIDNVMLRVRQPIIAIDGPAGAGKSTVTRRVAQALNLVYLDTGAMYRAIAWLVLQSGVELSDYGAIAELVSQAKLEFLPPFEGKPPQIYINGQDISQAIRTPQVTALVSPLSAQASVRAKLVAYQQQLGKKGGIVAEGRDIGTNVFPDAEVKIYLTASVQERARRRLLDFQAQGEENMSLEQLEHDIEQRDYLDSNRCLAPLRKAVDAIEINTDGLSIEEVIDKILNVCPK
ncbi:bifunctional pantoate--beta-alanine ligase/(d)CMP kinase [Aphanothece sacrum]|uniref:Bifunctional pantoate ligase/cytidylate kinase n=1 Tax=Aphanothece sacrum FPU1 TaxID=1920663 RepID=A0A401IDY9_APHSA|nr:bifunctional pantoate--beta-alanine ligase/(d)CMP kinase [Aphanothece sacrum]GBF79439.1 pantoate ligase/cytidylate kinase [Aphanothece sacrum FPU1]GBF86654.1 bifunctional pantoate ligase/cytidylate kinase [Aphanothece sacrum FPU3]